MQLYTLIFQIVLSEHAKTLFTFYFEGFFLRLEDLRSWAINSFLCILASRVWTRKQNEVWIWPLPQWNPNIYEFSYSYDFMRLFSKLLWKCVCLFVWFGGWDLRPSLAVLGSLTCRACVRNLDLRVQSFL